MITRDVWDPAGHRLQRILVRPEGEVRAGLLFFHGQGDYAEKYLGVLHPLVARGCALSLTDLPGHGRSPGRRGVVPGYDLIDALQEENLRILRSLTRGPLGLGGQSMGGHLVLRALAREPERFDFAWAGSPLLRFQQPDWMVALLTALGTLFPRLTWPTGVRPEDCALVDAGGADQPPPPDTQGHQRIGLGWARELADELARVEAALRTFPLKTPLLMTQGLADPVTLPAYFQELTAHMPRRPEVWLIPDGLHELYAGTEGLAYIERVANRLATHWEG
ncbi:MAG: alpha/beta fold hydrolase [Verrucomicrobiales bacterium]